VTVNTVATRDHEEQVELGEALDHHQWLLTSHSLATNLLGDDGLRSLLEHLPQTPISGRLE
jgi:hypothetical protein